MSGRQDPRISVCVPTFQRPAMLARCLGAIVRQQRVHYPYSVIVVDNDPLQSALSVAEANQTQSPVAIRYVHEPRQNISFARNAALANADGEWVAFIDDDEFPEPVWLHELCEALLKFKADGVLGPVLPRYTGNPPDWLVKSGLCDRESFLTGTWITNSKFMRTGNVLLTRRIFSGLDVPFDPRLGRTGGEDADFFGRMLSKGFRFVWCDEARVHEEVPPQRQTLNYHIRRACIRGVTEADVQPLFGLGTLKSTVAVVAYALALPILRITNRALFASYSVRFFDHTAKLLAHVGVKLANVRTF